MKKGPCMVLYNRTDDERISAIDFGILLPGDSSREISVWLWNKKNFSDAPTATDVRINAAAVNRWAEDAIDGKYLKVKSCGVKDPDEKEIIDDAEAEFSEIGGDVTDPESYHPVGDIPSNCARRLIFRLDVPEGAVMKGRPRLIFQAGYLSEDVKWLFASEDGDD